MQKFNLNAINSIQETTTSNDGSLSVLVEDLKPSPYQPRFKEEVSELANSINENGLLQPITINQDNIIIAGHRRYYAHIELELKIIQANIIITTDRQLHIFALIENIQREDLHPIELAMSYDAALKDGLFTSAKDLAKSISKPQSHVTKMRNILKLPDDIIQDIKYHKRKMSTETLSLLVQFEEHTLRELFELYKSGAINRTDIQQKLNLLRHNKSEPKKTFKRTQKSIVVSFSTAKLSDRKKDDLEVELKNLLLKYGLTDE